LQNAKDNDNGRLEVKELILHFPIRILHLIVQNLPSLEELCLLT